MRALLRELTSLVVVFAVLAGCERSPVTEPAADDEQAVDPLSALWRAREHQVLRLAVQVGDRAHTEVIGRLGEQPDRVRARERGRRVGHQVALVELVLRILERLLGV